ncbi:MAG: thioesterase family protein [Gemmatimonadota bacterium]
MDERVARHLDGYPVIVTNPVVWGEMDAFGHVNHTVFFRYFENSRIDYLTRVGFGDRERRDGIGPIMHSVSARFRLPLTYPDTAWTGVRVTEILPDRVLMEHRLVSETAGAVGAEGSAIVVSFDYDARQKTPLPDDVRAAIERLQA